MDPLKKIRPGDKVPLTAEGWNRLQDAARHVRDRAAEVGTGEFGGLFRQTGIVKILNDTGGDLPRFGVVEVSAPVIAPADNNVEFVRQVVMRARAAPTESRRVAVPIEPIPEGKIGRAVVSGVAVARVLVLSHSDPYCHPDDGDVERMVSGAYGPCLILCHAPDPDDLDGEAGSGAIPDLAYVLVGVPAGDGETLAQLTHKEYADDCPVYKGVAVAGGTSCEYSQDVYGPCLEEVYHEGGVDVPVCPVPSPLERAPSLVDDDLTNTGGDADWEFPSAATGGPDGQAATCVLEAGEETKILALNKLCFRLPSTVGGEDVEIQKVRVSVEASADGDGVEDAAVELVVGGSATGNSLHTGADLPADPAVRQYDSDGHTPSEWGYPTLGPSDVNANDFGVKLRYANTSGERRTVSVWRVTVWVSFDPDGVWEGLAVHRVRPANPAGSQHRFGGPPHWDFTRDTGDVETIDGRDYGVEEVYVYNQATHAWEAKRSARTIPVF